MSLTAYGLDSKDIDLFSSIEENEAKGRSILNKASHLLDRDRVVFHCDECHQLFVTASWELKMAEANEALGEDDGLCLPDDATECPCCDKGETTMVKWDFETIGEFTFDNYIKDLSQKEAEEAIFRLNHDYEITEIDETLDAALEEIVAAIKARRE